IGFLIVAIVRHAAEHASAVVMAYKSKMDVGVEIAFGSTVHVAMIVAPILVISSLFFNTQMPLIFSLPELIAMASAVLLTVILSNDGDTNWFECA
ncbi:calcium/proton exchanger, partial [Bacillus pumilus]